MFFRMLLLVLLSVSMSYAGTGFNYWPPGYGSDVLIDAWPSKRAEVEADLNHMASMGTDTIRFMFWPSVTGFQRYYMAGATLTADYVVLNQNLPDLLSMLQERNMKAVIAFANTMAFLKVNGTDLYRWEWAFGSSDADYEDFLDISEDWIRGIVNAVEQSAYANTVLYYDLQNEVRENIPHLDDYLRHMLDANLFPQGKRGVSIWTSPQDNAWLQTQLQGRPLDYVEFHTYPPANNTNIGPLTTTMRNQFPGATILMGEYARPTSVPIGESAQRDLVLQWTQEAQAANLPYILHWMLWDRLLDNPNFFTGMGYDPDTPKDVLGTYGEYLGLLYNSDFETANAGVPSGWVSGGTQSPQLISVLDNADAATNDRYGRLKLGQTSSANIWMVSPWINVQGGHQLFVNGFTRSNMTDLKVDVHEYDANGNSLGVVSSPSFTPSQWRWFNMQHALGPWHIRLKSQTRRVRIAFVGKARSANAQNYLDVDTVSVNTRP